MRGKNMRQKIKLVKAAIIFSITISIFVFNSLYISAGKTMAETRYNYAEVLQKSIYFMKLNVQENYQKTIA
jgi:hypothetical protein